MSVSASRLFRAVATLAVAALVFAACGEEGGSGEDIPEEVSADRESVMAEIDAIGEQAQSGELEYDPSADSDETIEALREAIPAPDGYPSRAVEIIIGFGEGGGSDNYVRNIGPDSGRIMDTDIVYNNVPGASGEVGMAQLTTAEPDGYTVASVITNQVINQAAGGQPYEFTDDFSFIIRQQGPTEVYWVAEDSEWETFDDMLEYAADNPGEVRVSGSGRQSDDEYRLLTLEDEIDSEFVYVPFDGVSERIQAILGGDIDVLHETAGTVYNLYEDGEIRPLAYGGDIVFDAIDPDIPSVADLGYEVPTGRWRGMVGLPDTDPEILEYLHNVFYAASTLPHYTEYEEEFFQDVAGGYLGPEDFQEASVEELGNIEQIIDELLGGEVDVEEDDES